MIRDIVAPRGGGGGGGAGQGGAGEWAKEWGTLLPVQVEWGGGGGGAGGSEEDLGGDVNIAQRLRAVYTKVKVQQGRRTYGPRVGAVVV